MTKDEARQLQVGEVVYVGALAVTVEDVKEYGGEVFIVTAYGNFNISVCERKGAN